MKRIILLSLLLVFNIQLSIAQNPDAFITTWRVPGYMPSISYTITLDAQEDGTNYTIDWGDGSDPETYVSSQAPSHTYNTAGDYNISFTGVFPHYIFGGYYDEPELIAVQQWGTQQWTSMFAMFADNRSLYHLPVQAPDLSLCTSMESMFAFDLSLYADIGNWDVSNVTNMSSMFTECYSFNQDIGNWDVSNVTNMNHMFSRATSFNQDIGNWDVSNVTDMSGMFYNVTLSTANYDALLIGWASNSNLQSNVIFHGGNSTYCNAENARNILVNNFGWTISDWGYDCSSLGIDETSVSDFSIFPNPANNVINIVSTQSKIDVLIFNVVGEQLLHKKATNKIDVSSLSKGVYFMRLLDGRNTSIKKFIKN